MLVAESIFYIVWYHLLSIVVTMLQNKLRYLFSNVLDYLLIFLTLYLKFDI